MIFWHCSEHTENWVELCTEDQWREDSQPLWLLQKTKMAWMKIYQYHAIQNEQQTKLLH